MSTEWNMDCEGGSGAAASFVVQVNVYVDDVLVATRTHTPIEGETAPWAFSVPMTLDGTHTVKVTDIDASGPTEYVVYDSVLVCAIAETTTTAAVASTEATTTTAAVTTASAAPATAASAQETVPVPGTLPVPPVVTPAAVTTLAPTTTGTALAETITAAPATLPATGSTAEPLLDLGLAFVLTGTAALFAARRGLRVRQR